MNNNMWQHILEGKKLIIQPERLNEGKLSDFFEWLMSYIKGNSSIIKKRAEELKNMSDNELRQNMLDIAQKLNISEQELNSTPTSLGEGILSDFFSDQWVSFKERIEKAWSWVTRGTTPYLILAVIGHVLVTSSILLTSWFVPTKFLVIFLWHLMGFHLKEKMAIRASGGREEEDPSFIF